MVDTIDIIILYIVFAVLILIAMIYVEEKKDNE
jgi:hypothetical protein